MKNKTGKTLIIVESPSKISSIQKYTGQDFIIKASVGHFMQLAKGGQYGIGIDVENNFKPHYIISPDKIQVLQDIINAADQCDKILLCTDPDREGEAISQMLADKLSSTGKEIKRATFNEITKTAIQKAINNPGEINTDLVNSQFARRALDRIIGFTVSPYLIKNFGDNQSAGRCQSVGVRMIVDREAEIQNFKPEEYHTFNINLANKDQKSFIAKFDGKLKNKQEVENLKKDICNPDIFSAEFIVDKVISKVKKETPPPPMITSKLQQIMSKKYGMSSDRTMAAAQKNYEKGICTYIRSDSFSISEDALKSVREYLTSEKHQIPAKPNEFKNSDASQNAHECIRPSNIELKPDQISGSDDEKAVYKVIWEHFVACQMLPAEFSTLEIKIKSKLSNHYFKSTGKALKSKGYLEILGSDTNTDTKIDIPMLSEKEIVKFFGKAPIDTQQKFTTPPPRYNEATFIEQLERKGIGRPATYAQLVKSLFSRGYIEKKGATYNPTDLGKKIIENLVKFFPFLNYDYTAKVEKQLDEIADGKLDHIKMMHDFFNPFKEQLSSAYKSFGHQTCEKCGSVMLVRKNKNDGTEFMGCSGYPKCKNAKPIVK